MALVVIIEGKILLEKNYKDTNSFSFFYPVGFSPFTRVSGSNAGTRSRSTSHGLRTLTPPFLTASRGPCTASTIDAILPSLTDLKDRDN